MFQQQTLAVCLVVLLLLILQTFNFPTLLTVWFVAEISHGAIGVSQVWRNSQWWSHLSLTPSGASALCSQTQRSLSILTPLASLCVHNSYLDSLCVLLINHLSAESSRSCITALSDDGDAAYFACKIPSRSMLIEWQWSKFGVAMQLQGWY